MAYKSNLSLCICVEVRNSKRQYKNKTCKGLISKQVQQQQQQQQQQVLQEDLQQEVELLKGNSFTIPDFAF